MLSFFQSKCFAKYSSLCFLIFFFAFMATQAKAQLAVVDVLQAAPGPTNMLLNGISGIGDQIATAVQLAFKGGSDSASGDANAQNLNEQQYTMAGNAGMIASEAVVPQQSTALEMAQFIQLRAAALDAAKGAIISLQSLALHIDSGVGADPGTPADTTARFCGLMGNGWSFVDSNRYGDLAQKLKCTGSSGSTDNKYSQANKMRSSVTDFAQYPLPKELPRRADNHIIFPTATAAYDTPWKDPVRFIAAWKYCESKIPKQTRTAVGTGRDASVADVALIVDDQDTSELNKFYDCIDEMGMHVACAQDSAIANVGGSGKSCFERQKEMCHALKDQIAPSGTTGLGLDSFGDANADNALRDCDSQGLSVAMADNIIAHKCGNLNWVSHLASTTGGNAAEVERQQNGCAGEIIAYEAGLRARKERL